MIITDNRVIGTLVMNSQQTGGYEEDESNMRVAEYSNNSEGEESSDMYEDYQQDSEQGLFSHLKIVCVCPVGGGGAG